MNKVKCALLLAIVLLPLSSLFIHTVVHADFPVWAFWFTVIDIVLITSLLAYEKTKTYGFWLNTVFCLVGMFYHVQFSLMGTLSDNMILLADLLIGYAIFGMAEPLFGAKSVSVTKPVSMAKRKK